MLQTKSTITSFTDLHAWQESHKLAIRIYELTKTFPREEQYGLTSQIRRAGLSIADQAITTGKLIRGLIKSSRQRARS